ncbi:MAG TPA: hypothetical protein VLM83_13555, partial [Anaerolineales bacterium]|nr:hypothetical protein [Anaerolineales bacterium]
MIKTNTLQKFLIIVGLMLLVTSGLAACQGKAESTPAGDDSPVSQPEQPAQGGDQGETGGE